MFNQETRSAERIREHYNLEKKLAEQLRNSNETERTRLYTSLYEKLFQSLPDHPQIVRKEDLQLRKLHISDQMKLLRNFLHNNSRCLEIGAGDCSLSLEISKYVEKVYALDVSETITKQQAIPQNFELIISDGTSIPLADESITIAYSNQLMEHLHPDDAVKQLRNIYHVLADDGIYICCTPNKLNGPHDISEYFDRVATGFHLKEYTITELSTLFSEVGFSHLKIYKNFKSILIGFSPYPFILIEWMLSKLPYKMGKKIASALLFRWLLNIIIVGRK
ncbi:class I SAM-dependent methyltransferase [Calothrix sp. UHCC 0171]|uniref:class I SAM-dependent methyltransferase n=1 Tax=Calothrix sp. UHCC 0171 TaxID=3110245 RepID=UPI002B21A2CF|nr:class I SAM-dependent methyltransferase [Calothrix sp. UHCC 0171]MEA5571826.1 class I SAM-dependent methyltransferase [Calothrix sp. UHCC 0171]